MKKLILALALAILAIGANAQSNAGVDTLTFVKNDTLFFNSIDSIKVYFVNYGPQAFTGTVYAEYWVDTSFAGIPTDTLSTDSFSVTNWMPNTSVPDSAFFVVDARFKSGINTVVIWPRSADPNFITADSLEILVYVMAPSGMPDPDILLPARVFPNPAAQLVYITDPDPGLVIERVRIFTSEGKLHSDTLFRGRLDVSLLPAGTYVVEFVRTKGQTSRCKLIKE